MSRPPTRAKYLTNRQLTEEIVACQQSNTKPNVVSDKLARMLMLFCVRFSFKANWRGYSFRSEMVSDALTHLCTCTSKCDEFGELLNIPRVLGFDTQYSVRAAEAESIKQGKHINAIPNPFAFITQIVKHCFIHRIKHEKKQNTIRDDILADAHMTPSFAYQGKDDSVSTWMTSPTADNVRLLHPQKNKPKGRTNPIINGIPKRGRPKKVIG